MKRTTLWLDETDKQAIRLIKSKYGIGTNSAAIRVALRIFASSNVDVQIVAEVIMPRQKTVVEKT